MSPKTNLKIEKACIDALEKIRQIGRDDFNEVQSKLEYVIGSYQFDHNPVGLYEVGAMTLNKLKGVKTEKPKLITKKLLDDLEKALTSA